MLVLAAVVVKAVMMVKAVMRMVALVVTAMTMRMINISIMLRSIWT